MPSPSPSSQFRLLDESDPEVLKKISTPVSSPPPVNLDWSAVEDACLQEDHQCSPPRHSPDDNTDEAPPTFPARIQIPPTAGKDKVQGYGPQSASFGEEVHALSVMDMHELLSQRDILHQPFS